MPSINCYVDCPNQLTPVVLEALSLHDEEWIEHMSFWKGSHLGLERRTVSVGQETYFQGFQYLAIDSRQATASRHRFTMLRSLPLASPNHKRFIYWGKATEIASRLGLARIQLVDRQLMPGALGKHISRRACVQLDHLTHLWEAFLQHQQWRVSQTWLWAYYVLGVTGDVRINKTVLPTVTGLDLQGTDLGTRQAAIMFDYRNCTSQSVTLWKTLERFQWRLVV
jgi:hypothetical protein